MERTRVLAIAALSVITVLAGCGKSQPPAASTTGPSPSPGAGGAASAMAPASASPSASKPAIPRDAFQAAVLGLPQDKVVAAVGKPDSTSGGYSPVSYWSYHGKTTSANGKKDAQTIVKLENGKVTGVSYQ